MLNLTSGWVRWSPPPPQHHNGRLLGYKIQVKAGNTGKLLAQMTLNASTTSVLLNNLTTGAIYNIRVVSYTRIGAGPYSPIASLVMNQNQPYRFPRGQANDFELNSFEDLQHRAQHFVEGQYIASITILLLLLSFLVTTTILVLRRRSNVAKRMRGTNSIAASSADGKSSVWIDNGWQPNDTDKDSGLSESKLLNSSSGHHVSYGDATTDYAEVDIQNGNLFFESKQVCGCWRAFREENWGKKSNYFSFQISNNPMPYATTILADGTCAKCPSGKFQSINIQKL